MAIDLNSVAGIDNAIQKLPIKENPLASQLGVKSYNSNMLQFYNRFGQNNLLQQTPLATVIARPYYFDSIWSFKPFTSKVEQLLRASLKESSTEALKYFIQSVELPDIETYNPMEAEYSGFGMVSNTGLIVKPSQNTFTIQFLNTEFNLHSHVFYYWMRESVDNKWSYEERPFTKANLTITFFDSDKKRNMFSYILTNIFPISIQTTKPNHSGDIELTNGVTFSFDNMYVTSEYRTEIDRIEKVFNKYLGNDLSRTLTTGINKKLPSVI